MTFHHLMNENAAGVHGRENALNIGVQGVKSLRLNDGSVEGRGRTQVYSACRLCQDVAKGVGRKEKVLDLLAISFLIC